MTETTELATSTSTVTSEIATTSSSTVTIEVTDNTTEDNNTEDNTTEDNTTDIDNTTTTTTLCSGHAEGCYVSECGGDLVEDEWCQKNKGRCEAPGQSCNGVWCKASPGSCPSTTVVVPTSTTTTTSICNAYAEGCYVSECGGDLVEDEWCQKNKGRCEAPGQSCNGVWCKAGSGTCPSTTVVPTSTTSLNGDCAANILGFIVVIVGVDITDPNFEATLKSLIAAALGTSPDCIVLLPATSTLPSRRLQSTVSQPGTAGVAAGATQEQVQTALNSDSFKSSVCSSLGGGPTCSVTSVAAATTTTTTTDMPWGLPWWAWFLICCGVLLLCALCCLLLGGAAMAMGGKKKSKPGPSTTTTETVYEVIDEPDDVPLVGSVPMATAVLPMSSAYPTTSATYPVATTASNIYWGNLVPKSHAPLALEAVCIARLGISLTIGNISLSIELLYIPLIPFWWCIWMQYITMRSFARNALFKDS